ncbi:MAG: hypothetical protein ACLTSL_18485 [Odoribacter splanchnicus]
MIQQESGYSEEIKTANTLFKEYVGSISEVEKKRRCMEIQQELQELTILLRQKMSIDFPGVLLCLLDIYEVTRDEGMLQEVLDVVGRNLDRLVVSVESVKLLACCYYYVEEEECAERARRMLEELRKMGRGEEELADVETILEELT